MKKNKIALITGVFNVLHPGHVDLFRFASKYADKIIVGVIADKNSDKKSIISEKYRLQAVASKIISILPINFIICILIINHISFTVRITIRAIRRKLPYL